MDGPPTTALAPTLALAGLLALGLAPAPLLPHALVALRNDDLNHADIERTERGYYESVLDAGRTIDSVGITPPAEPQAAEPTPFDAGPLGLVVPDVREFVLRPNLRTDLRGASWSTNAFGMRDRPYTRRKPPGTARIAFIGDSIGAGWGVPDDYGFEARLERALDARSRAAGGPAVEILNFAVPGHAPGQRWEDFLGADGWSFGPDIVLYEATPADPGWDERRLRGLLARGVGADAAVYRDVLDRVGLPDRADAESYKRRLRPHRRAILAAVYRTIAADCRARGIPCVWVLVPRVGRPGDPAETARLRELAANAGFSSLIDLSDAYRGCDPIDLAIGPNDFHPNVEGHKRLAAGLEQALVARPELTRSLGRPTGDASVVRAGGRP
jgi:hypothetical protein